KDHMRYVLFDLRPGLLDGVGIAEARALPQFRVYPNPVEDSFQIVFDRNVAGVVELRDMTGRMACSQSVEDRSVSFDATLLAPGVYFAGLCNSRLAPVRVVIQ
ncbi:MAG: T9SS type A sorting domain-containing protein, partial [Bacteroidota bacterium]